MKKFFNEFKEFIARGNVVDMAVGVVVGSSFTAIVTSLVNDIIMPFVGIVVGGISFADLAYTTANGAVLAYGNFIQNVVNFLLVAFVLFSVVRVMNSLKRKKEEQPAVPEKKGPSTEEILLEIRDLLKDSK